jgi:hypothetical protein
MAGCGGSEDDYENKPRPPSPIVVSASINDGRIAISPRRFGAGPVTLIVANQTDRARNVKLATDELGGDQPGINQETGPINPGDTASLKANLREGSYRVSVENGGEVNLSVGEPRPSSQNKLLQP